MKIKSKNIFFIFALFMVLLCCFSAVSASENVDDSVAVSDDVAMDEVVSEVDSDDESISVQENEEIESSDDEDNAIYVNISSEIEGLDGKSWETAYGGEYCFDDAVYEISNGGTIYLANGNYLHEDYDGIYPLSFTKNMTFIGQGSQTNLTNIEHQVYGDEDRINCIYTFINLTLTGKMFGVNSNFINCTIMGKFSVSEDFIKQEPRHIEEYGYAKTYFMNFDNCVFKDVTTDSALVTLYQYGAVNFNNCTFENIVADSLVYRNATTYFEEDGISFKDCTFTNCKYNGVVDSAANFDDAITIEDCNYDSEVAVGTTDVNGHFYVNATKLKVVAVDSAVDISSSEKGVVVITLTDGTNPIAGATVKYTVNGGEEQTVTTGEDGKATISGLTGEVTIAVNYEGNESYNAISDTKSFNFTEEPVVPAKVATKITAPKVSAVYNVAKNLVITLTDKDGKALANKKVTVKVGTISKTLNTNAKGQVSLNVATLVPKTYTASVKFAGDDAYLASSQSPKVVVSKAKPKITAKAKTFKVKVKTKKYTVTLKNNKGKVMKKVKLTLKVGKKTYKATTNSKGKATFKITKLTKKGKYTATVKFAGSKYYKAISKKVKITVKK
ncbi:MAG: hypothetical protein Q4Q24_06475 [Methanobrevibacter ruminantium]|uniref:hypothetical protein n=1 Tax=Methanobrevibacter ruminantium TaxID=83816 RepID=UPI0026EF94F9|nr:hypothetical protein [Methanobrevibacter ruminantium]MDO5842891.1 hypothetical protein [Methanobrevibacter ruminantium]